VQIAVIGVGKLKEKFWREALAEYAKRLSGYVQLELLEVADEPAAEELNDAGRRRVLQVEAERIAKLLRDRDGIIALDIHGKMLDSIAWSQQYDQLCGAGYGRLVFVIGGSNGLHHTLLQRAAFRWSFGAMTLPHQLARVVLLEQMYRGIRIGRGEPYHK